jgi:hypothetical protein
MPGIGCAKMESNFVGREAEESTTETMKNAYQKMTSRIVAVLAFVMAGATQIQAMPLLGTAQPVPDASSTMALLGVALTGLAVFAWRQRK